jgi:hypothetical protein
MKMLLDINCSAKREDFSKVFDINEKIKVICNGVEMYVIVF